MNNKNELTYLNIDKIPRLCFKMVWQDKKKNLSNILVELKTKAGVISFWLSEKGIYTNNYTLDATISLVSSYTYEIKMGEKNYKVTGEKLYNIIAKGDTELPFPLDKK